MIIQNTDKYRIENKLFLSIESFLTECETNVDVKQTSILSRFIYDTINLLADTCVREFETTIDAFHHKYTTDSIGTFYFFRPFDPITKTSILYINDWDWKIDPDVFKKLYPTLLQTKPISSKEEEGGCGMIKITAPNGWQNFLKQDKKLLCKKTWFQKVVPFNNQTQIAYVRDLNGNVGKLYLNGMPDYHLSNWEKYEAEGLLGENKSSSIDNIITEAINSYLRKNLLLAS